MHEDNDFFKYIPEGGIWATFFRDWLAYVGCAADINPNTINPDKFQTEKPVYCGFMARRDQLQPILDNPHLFDPMFVNAVRTLATWYEELEVR